jgi:LacI family transcriptional regulator
VTEGTGVTLADVARHAGFSRSTASLVFQESPLVADATRRAVLGSAAALGYVYNRRAAALRTQRSETIGLLIPGLVNPFFAALVQAVEEELAPSGYTVLLGNTLEAPKRQEALIRTLLENRVDGLLIVPAIGSEPGMVGPLERLGIPHVLVTRRVAGLGGDWVGSDDDAGGALVATHLLEHGCRRLAYFGGPTEVYARATRHAAFDRTVKAAGAGIDEHWSRPTATSSSAGYDATVDLLAEREPPDGIACHSDAIAFGVMRALRDAGVDVGTRMRVIGFDDVEHARAWSPSLTSVSVSSGEMGRAAARMLLGRLERRDTAAVQRTAVFTPVLKVRESCGVEHVPSTR